MIQRLLGLMLMCLMALNASAARENLALSSTTGIDSIATGDTSVVAIYNLSGVKVNTYQKGINIVRLSDGTTKKILVK